MWNIWRMENSPICCDCSLNQVSDIKSNALDENPSDIHAKSINKAKEFGTPTGKLDRQAWIQNFDSKIKAHCKIDINDHLLNKIKTDNADDDSGENF